MYSPKGFIVSIGGAHDPASSDGGEEGKNPEHSFFETAVLSQIISMVEKGQTPQIELLTTACMHAESTEQKYKRAFSKLGCHDIGTITIKSRKDLQNPEYLHRVATCNVVLFMGDDQLCLSSIYGGSDMLEIIKERYRNEPVVIAGTNAASMVLSHTMLFGKNAGDTHLKGKIKLSTGFGLLPNIIIDTQFEGQGRFNRLVQAVATQPGLTGIGLGSNSGIIIAKGNQVKATGPGVVTIIDGKQITHNNIADVKGGMAVSIHNLAVHLLSHEDVFDLGALRYSSLDN